MPAPGIPAPGIPAVDKFQITDLFNLGTSDPTDQTILNC